MNVHYEQRRKEGGEPRFLPVGYKCNKCGEVIYDESTGS